MVVARAGKVAVYRVLCVSWKKRVLGQILSLILCGNCFSLYKSSQVRGSMCIQVLRQSSTDRDLQLTVHPCIGWKDMGWPEDLNDEWWETIHHWHLDGTSHGTVCVCLPCMNHCRGSIHIEMKRRLLKLSMVLFKVSSTFNLSRGAPPFRSIAHRF